MSIFRRNVAVLVALASLTFASVSIGLAPSANAIVNGTEISPGALSPGAPFGWLVRLEGVGDSRCTGSLIASEWVLTAAHCADIGNDDGSGITAFFGAIGSDEGVAIDQVEQHPDFDGGSNADLALMQLSAPVSRAPVHIVGISDSLASGTQLQIAGWGATSTDGDMPTKSRSGTSEVTEVFPQVVVSGETATACAGDSGGPALASGVLVAVISASDPACAESTILTRLSAHRDWITSVTGIGTGNLPPIATGGSITAAAGEQVELSFTFSDPDSGTAFVTGIDFDLSVWDEASLSCIEQPGVVVCLATPLLAVAQTIDVVYQVSDGNATAIATWEVIFVLGPTAPVADDASTSAVAGRTTELQLTASDANDDPITFAIVEPPLRGSLDCSAGVCSYTAVPGYTGSDAFNFTATDAGGLVSNIATVSIEVATNVAPEVFDFTLSIGKNTTNGIALAGDDLNGDALAYTIVSGPAHGTLDGCSTGDCTYRPNLDYEGFDSFTYSATDPDGLQSGEATVTIEVAGNFAPTAEDVTVQTKEGSTVVIELRAFDRENDVLTFHVESPPANGTLEGCATGLCLYTPVGGFSGPDTFTWTASDGARTSQLAVATIEVVAINWDVTPLESATSGRQLMAAILDGDLTGAGSFSGATAAAGTFSGAADAIGIDTGIVLSTGRVVDVVGPNFDESRSTNHNNSGADDLFTSIDSHDAVSLSYEVVPAGNQLHFRYVLASEEYNEGGYVFPGYDDTALVSVDGRACGLQGAANGLPLVVSAIRVGTYDDDFQPVEDPLNADLFVDNQFGSSEFDTEMDGFSTVIECTLDVVAGQAVVVTIAIADGGDGSIDSALFIEGDLSPDGAPVADAGPDRTLNEGDIVALDNNSADDGPLQYAWSSTKPLVAAVDPSGTAQPNLTAIDNGSAVVGLEVVDTDGGTATDTATITVLNVAPMVTGSSAEVDERSLYTGTLSFTDPGTLDTHTATIDYGDGSTVNLSSVTGRVVPLSHRYVDNGSYQITVTVTDDDLGAGTGVVSVTVRNVAPTVNDSTDVIKIDEGSTYTDTLNFTDPGTLDTHTATVDYGDGTPLEGPHTVTHAVPLSHRYIDDRSYPVSVTVTDKDGGTDTGTASVTVLNVAPVVGAVTGPIVPVLIGTTVNVSAPFTDVGIRDLHTATINWGDAVATTGTVAQGAGSGRVSGSKSYSSPGIYTVTVHVGDDDGGTGSAQFLYVVVYDPAGGFVTGGGLIDSPAGAYLPAPLVAGRAQFAFISKYKKGASIPQGTTSFRFNAADFVFASTSYEWLVVSGAKATYKGRGTVNGAGDYGFLLSTVDGDAQSVPGPDRLRLKVWNRLSGVVIYDNQLGAANDAPAATAIAAGAITVSAPRKR